MMLVLSLLIVSTLVLLVGSVVWKKRRAANKSQRGGAPHWPFTQASFLQ